jgi:DNA-binding response OmpR family regulator
MRTQNLSTLASADGCNGSLLSDRGSPETQRSDPKKGTILLISDDAKLQQNLRSIANLVGRIVVRVGAEADVARIVYAIQPAVVLLDLDLPAGAGWEKADVLFQEQRCPPLILLTARSEQLDVRTAMQAGAVLDKSADLTRLLEQVDRTLAARDSSQDEQTAIQRVVIRWLRPCSFQVSFTPSNRFWGINE